MAMTKEEALILMQEELNDLVNYAGIANNYFDRSRAWIIQRLHGNVVNGVRATFKPEEYGRLARALRDMAYKFMTAADNIENGEI